MLKITKAIAATGLGVMMSFSFFTPGAFAQSINQNSASQVVVQGASLASETQGGNSHNDPSWLNNNRKDRGRDHYRHVRCVRTARWVHTRHGLKRVWVRVCHR